MDDMYFAEFALEKNNAFIIGSSHWVLYDGPLPILSEVPSPTAPFRIAITVSGIEGHDITDGSVHVNDEEIHFSGPTRRTTEAVLDSLPEISIDGLDCNILIECINPDGSIIELELLTLIEIICFPKTHILRDPNGSGYMETAYDIYTLADLAIGDRIRFEDPHQGKTIDIYVKNKSSAVDLEDLSQPFRVYNCA